MRPIFVVIPIKGHDKLTNTILSLLADQDAHEHIFIFDNAGGFSYKDPKVSVIDALGDSISRMWNRGIEASLERSTVCDIAILNNDLDLGDDFLSRMAAGLRSRKFTAVSANYDGRRCRSTVQPVKGLAAGREDGTGGFAGFAFMVRGELFAGGFPPFDEQFELWCGDTDFLVRLDLIGATYGIVNDARVTHIGGGSQTTGGNGLRLTPENRLMAERDWTRFAQKWGLACMERPATTSSRSRPDMVRSHV